MLMNITVLYNNVPHDARLETGWGFSCLIEGMEKTILFDTGGDGRVLLSNMKVLGKRAEQTDVVFLSHVHGDHSGGLWDFLREHGDVELYVPESFPPEFKQRAEKAGARVIAVDSAAELGEGIHSTGQMGQGPKEQALILRSPRGLVVVTGCAHPGVVNMVRRAKEICKDEIYLLLGGLHLGAYAGREVEGIVAELKKLGVKKVGPSHCTGEKPTEMFREAWGKDFLDLGCGATFSTEGEDAERHSKQEIR